MNEKIQIIRNQTNTTVKKLCEYLDIKPQSYYVKVKNDNFSLNDLKKLSVLFDVPLSHFITDIESNTKTAISKDNNGNLVQNSKNVNIDTCKQEIAHLKELLKAKDEIIELYKSKNQ